MARVWHKIPIYRDNIPKYILNGAIGVYFIAVATLFVLYRSYLMSLMWVLIGGAFIMMFFYGSKQIAAKWRYLHPKRFEKKLFQTALALRLTITTLLYGFFYVMTDGFFDFEPADVEWYHEVASDIATWFYNGNWNIWQTFNIVTGGRVGLDDSGYPLYLSVVYILTNKSILLARLVQCVWSTYTCLFVYRIAQRHFEEPTARLAAIFCMFMPNMVIYCGLHLKETVMTFLTLWFVDRADALMINRNFSFRTVIGVALIGLSLFSFRTVLGAALFLSFAMALVFSSTRLIRGGRRTLLIALSFSFVVVAFSGRLKEEVMTIVNSDIRGQQRTSMQLRYGSGKGSGGNRFVDNVGAAVFAPLIFTLPFPTMVNPDGQEQKLLMHGGNYVKNVMSGLVILSMFMMLFGGDIRSLDAEWRKHVLPLAVYLGYLVILTFSQFAHSERFHQPILPFAMLFAAYGLTHFKPRQRWMWSLWLVVIFAICIGWQYIKLRGRGY